MSRLILATLGLGLVLSLGGCAQTTRTTDLPEPGNLAQETTQTSVFYSSGRSLFEEYVIVDASQPYEGTLRELLGAMPENNPDVAIVQPTADFNSVVLEDGVLTIDWSAEILEFEAEDSEKVLALASFLRTFGNFPEIEKVRFTVEGQTDGEVDGKDVQAFWGRVSLIDQPWDVIRPGVPPSDQEESTETAQ